MSGLAIAFPAEVAATVAQVVIDGVADAAWALLILAVGAVLLILCKPYASQYVSQLASALRGPIGCGLERLKHLAH